MVRVMTLDKLMIKREKAYQKKIFKRLERRERLEAERAGW